MHFRLAPRFWTLDNIVLSVVFVIYTGEHELMEELFEQIKPGLSAYANDPRKASYISKHILCSTSFFLFKWKLFRVNVGL